MKVIRVCDGIRKGLHRGINICEIGREVKRTGSGHASSMAVLDESWGALGCWEGWEVGALARRLAA